MSSELEQLTFSDLVSGQTANLLNQLVFLTRLLGQLLLKIKWEVFMMEMLGSHGLRLTPITILFFHMI
jgi:hypothetical protein